MTRATNWLIALLVLASAASAAVTSIPCDQLPALTGYATSSAGSCATSQGTVPSTIASGGTGVTSGAGQWLTTPITVDFSVAGDNAITVPLPSGFTRIGFCAVMITGIASDISAANFGMWTTTGGTGGNLVAAATAITVTNGTDNTLNNFQSTNCANVATESYTPNAGTIQFRVGTTAASGRTAKVAVRYSPLP